MTGRFSPAARTEFDAAIAYYEQGRPGLGARFAAEVEASIERAGRNPEVYRIFADDLRRCRVAGFPYGIVFRLRDDALVIIAVMHLHRRPNYWRGRLFP